jgi:hypothetical protein
LKGGGIAIINPAESLLLATVPDCRLDGGSQLRAMRQFLTFHWNIERRGHTERAAKAEGRAASATRESFANMFIERNVEVKRAEGLGVLERRETGAHWRRLAARVAKLGGKRTKNTRGLGRLMDGQFVLWRRLIGLVRVPGRPTSPRINLSGTQPVGIATAHPAGPASHIHLRLTSWCCGECSPVSGCRHRRSRPGASSQHASLGTDVAPELVAHHSDLLLDHDGRRSHRVAYGLRCHQFFQPTRPNSRQ